MINILIRNHDIKLNKILLTLLLAVTNMVAMEQPKSEGNYSAKTTADLINLFKKSNHFTKDKLITEAQSLLQNGANPNAGLVEERRLILGDNGRDYFTKIKYHVKQITPLENAININSPELVKLLLDAGAIPNIHAFETRASLLAIALLDKKFCVTEIISMAELRFSCKFPIAELLISHGANIQNAFDIISCGSLTDNRALNFLIKQGADVNSSCGKSLLTAAENRDAEKMKILLEAGADPNVISQVTGPFHQGGYTPLMKAVLHKQITTVRLLLENGAQTDIKNKQGQTALDLAIENNAGNEIEGLLRNPPPVKKLGIKKQI